MLWIIAIIIILIVSLFLALRSMKDFQEPSTGRTSFSLFLIRNISALDTSTLVKIAQITQNLDGSFALERLSKGSDFVLAIFGPSSIQTQLPELNLLELEDYLEDPKKDPTIPIDPKKTQVNDSLAWVISAKADPKKQLILKEGFLKKLDLQSDQHVFLQIVLHPQKNNGLQATIRILVSDKNPNQRIELSKKIDEQIIMYANLQSQPRIQTTLEVFEEYRKRSFIPKEIAEFSLTTQEILDLLSLD